jgi:hypothetical protein
MIPTAAAILEKHLSSMVGRVTESYVSIDEMKEQPEWQVTIDAMIEFATQIKNLALEAADEIAEYQMPEGFWQEIDDDNNFILRAFPDEQIR